MVGFLTFNHEVEQYLVTAVLRPGNAPGSAGAVFFNLGGTLVNIAVIYGFVPAQSFLSNAIEKIRAARRQHESQKRQTGSAATRFTVTCAALHHTASLLNVPLDSHLTTMF
jgi:hypothetical protein